MSLFNDASLIITPNGVKAGKLYALKGGDLTVTRATSATYVGADGLIKTALANEVRFDYSNGSCPSILVEPQRTNILLNSETLATQSVTVTAQPYTLSFYGSGTVVLSGTHSATVVGLGTARKNYTFTPTAGTLTLTVTGTCTKAQLEAGSYATSYIPTTSASVTRNADVISKTGIGSIFGTSYTVYGDFINQNVNSTRLLTLKIPSGGNYDNFITIYQNGTALTATGNNASSAEQFTITSGSFSLNQRLKFALRCENNNVAFYINGTQIGVDNSCTIPAVTALFLGNYVDVFGVSVINSTAIFNSALTNTELAQLTTI